MSRRLLWIALAAYLVALALIAYWPTPVDRGVDGDLFGAIHWLRAHGITLITYDRVESAANVALFVPFGLLLGGLFRRGRRWIAFLLCWPTSPRTRSAAGSGCSSSRSSPGPSRRRDPGNARRRPSPRRTADLRSRRERARPVPLRAEA